MSNLSRRENSTITALAECIIPVGGPIPNSFNDINYLPFIKESLTAFPTHIRWLFHFNLWFIEYFGCFYLRRPKAFSKLAFDQREFVLSSFKNSKRYFIRGIYLLTSALFLIPMYKDEAVMDAIGYFGYKNDVNKIS